MLGGGASFGVGHSEPEEASGVWGLESRSHWRYERVGSPETDIDLLVVRLRGTR